jgi:hypothetical protein
MKIVKHGDNFVITRGEQYFSFFVDSDRSSWSKKIWASRTYENEEEAKRDYFELKQRARMRRKP